MSKELDYIADLERENRTIKSILYCTKRSCNNCGKVNCENFQRQRIDCCGLWVSYKDYIKQQEEQIESQKKKITQAHTDGHNRGYAKAKEELETENNKLLDVINNQDVKIADLEQKLEQTEKDLADYQFNYPKIKELEKENAELREKYLQATDEGTSFAHLKSLERENAELKAKLNFSTQYYQGEKAKEQLTKATEILKRFIETSNPIYFEEDRQKVKTQAEQFLRETDIDNAIQKANEGLDLDKIADEVEEDLNGDGCPDILCEDCTKEDCTVRKLGLVKTCSTCKHFSKDVDAEEPCKSCYRQSYWEKEKCQSQKQH